MKELKNELRMLLAEKLIYWAFCLSPEVIDLFVRKENRKMEQLVKEAKEHIRNKSLPTE